MQVSDSSKEVRKTIYVDGDTTIYLKGIEDNTEKIYCVYSKKKFTL